MGQFGEPQIFFKFEMTFFKITFGISEIGMHLAIGAHIWGSIFFPLKTCYPMDGAPGNQ